MSSTIGVAEAGADAGDRNTDQPMYAMVGYHYRVADYYEVGREKVREFARAVQDYHPVHWEEDAAREYGYPGLVASPTFVAQVVFLAQRRLAGDVLRDYGPMMQTDQVFEWRRPVLAGDRLSCDVYLETFRQAFGGDMIGAKTVVTDQNGETVAVSRMTVVGKAGEKDETALAVMDTVAMHGLGPGGVPATREPSGVAPSSPRQPLRVGTRARAFDAVEAGAPLAARTVALTLGDLVNYAGVSGDPNPIHWSPEVAGLIEGLNAAPGSVLAHGMLSMGLGASYITDWLGDPGALLEYNVRFTSPVFVSPDRPGEIVYTGKVKSVDAATSTAVVAITATHNGRKIFGRATAKVLLA